MTKPKALILSLIPVQNADVGFEAENRWTQDINAQVEQHSVTLLCPIEQHIAPNFGLIDPRIQIAELADADLRQLITQCDFVQLPGNYGWCTGAVARRLMRLAKSERKPVFLGISSDRAKTAWINRRKGPIGLAKGALRWLDVRLSQRLLARRAAGVFVVGNGIVRLAKPNTNVHVSTASWISSRDKIEPINMRTDQTRIACASRLDPMKGVEMGVRAVAQLSEGNDAINLDIVGEGPELGRLKELVSRLGLQSATRFLGQLSYPEQFLSYLRTVDLVLLTNLNDEQPRLIFDAISQGCFPICPNSSPYVALGLDRRVLYDRGDANAAAETITRLLCMSKDALQEIAEDLRKLAGQYTLEAMHQRRAAWIAQTRSQQAS